MCVKSSEGAGELLHHLEEKMEVARVQLMVLDAVRARPELAREDQACHSFVGFSCYDVTL